MNMHPSSLCRETHLFPEITYFTKLFQEIRRRDRPQRLIKEEKDDRRACRAATHQSHQRLRQIEQGGNRIIFMLLP